MLLLRRVVFVIFFMLYLIVCPLTVLYALGYLVKPGPGHAFVKTGLIHVATLPIGATIVLDNQDLGTRTPSTLQNLLPGIHVLRLSLPGYEPWVRVVPVEAEQATVLAHVLLVPERPVTKELLAEPIAGIAGIEDSHLLLLTKGPMLGAYQWYDWSREKLWPVTWDHPTVRSARVLRCVTERQSHTVLFEVELARQHLMLLAELRGNEVHFDDVTKLFPEIPDRVHWDATQHQYLFALHRGSLDRLDVTSMAIHPRLLESIRGFGLFNKAVYALTSDTMLERMDDDAKHPSLLSEKPVLRGEPLGQREQFDLLVLADDAILFLGSRGSLLANRWPYVLAERGILGLHVDPTRQHVLTWQRDQLGLLDLTRELRAENATAPTLQMRWIALPHRRIEQACWVYNASHVLLRDQDAVWLLDLEDPQQAPPRHLVDLAPGSAVLYTEESGALYYLDRATSHLWMLEVIPRQALLPLPLPERSPELPKPMDRP